MLHQTTITSQDLIKSASIQRSGQVQACINQGHHPSRGVKVRPRTSPDACSEDQRRDKRAEKVFISGARVTARSSCLAFTSISRSAWSGERVTNTPHLAATFSAAKPLKPTAGAIGRLRPVEFSQPLHKCAQAADQPLHRVSDSGDKSRPALGGQPSPLRQNATQEPAPSRWAASGCVTPRGLHAPPAFSHRGAGAKTLFTPAGSRRMSTAPREKTRMRRDLEDSSASAAGRPS